jgi:hypothetical protein
MDIPNVASNLTANSAPNATDALKISNPATSAIDLQSLSSQDQALLAQTGSVGPEQAVAATALLETGSSPVLETAQELTPVSFEPLKPGRDPLTLDLPANEAKIYQDAGLRALDLDENDYLVRPDMDWTFKDNLGTTNLERAQAGRAPIDPTTKLPIRLHHIGQRPDSPLAELTELEHNRPPNNLVLHPVRENSNVDHGSIWNAQREKHWMARAQVA